MSYETTSEPVTVAAPGAPREPDIAIHVRDVGKMYRIYNRPQDRLKQMLLWRFGRQYGHEFWALRGVSFDVRRGEAVGIIGRNGSGKSTLLQVIAGTLALTEGTTQVTGRVAALLELGSGFNPEYTGRENVYLNGAILGLDKQAMDSRFEQIAAFADIGEFIDQPVKMYSSGMVVRLAFAVQAHVDPEVLIVDEALAVGDSYFQHKCMRHIKELLDRGTTLLFVTHSTETVKRFCQYGLWLHNGQMRYFGEAGVAVEKYLASMRMEGAQGLLSNGISLETGALDDDTALPTPDTFLPTVTSTVDLADERLFVRGSWRWSVMPEADLAVRTADDSSALAGFHWHGDRLELRFLSGPRAARARITLDGVERLVELAEPGGWQVRHVQLDVPRGNHTVYIRPEASGGPARVLNWLGGNARTTTTLAFQRDHSLARDTGAVERYGTGRGRLTAVELLDYTTEQPVHELRFGQRVRLRLHAERLGATWPRLEFSFIVRDKNRVDLFGSTTIDEGVVLDVRASQFVVEFAFDVRLGPGSYSILASFVECSDDLSQRVPLDQIDIAQVFTVAFDPSRPVWYLFHTPLVVEAASLHAEGDR